MRRNWHKLVFGIALTLCGIVLATVVLKQRQYVKEHILNSVEVLWNEGEAFLQIGKTTNVASGSLAGMFLRQLVSLMSFEGDIQEQEMIMWHIESRSVVRHVVSNVEPGGSIFPHDGILHYSVGVKSPVDWPAVWRWNGESFEKLEKPEAERIVNSFSIYDEIIDREGWRVGRPSFTQGEAIQEFEINGSEISVILREVESDYMQERTILLQTNVNEEIANVLIRTSNSYRRVN